MPNPDLIRVRVRSMPNPDLIRVRSMPNPEADPDPDPKEPAGDNGGVPSPDEMRAALDEFAG